MSQNLHHIQHKLFIQCYFCTSNQKRNAWLIGATRDKSITYWTKEFTAFDPAELIYI